MENVFQDSLKHSLNVHPIELHQHKKPDFAEGPRDIALISIKPGAPQTEFSPQRFRAYKTVCGMTLNLILPQLLMSACKERLCRPVHIAPYVTDRAN